jgi:hypothetical protein
MACYIPPFISNDMYLFYFRKILSKKITKGYYEMISNKYSEELN